MSSKIFMIIVLVVSITILTIYGCGKFVGSRGAPGQGCTVMDAENGVVISCGDRSLLVRDGQNGEDSNFAIKELIDPCGDEAKFDEILIRLRDDSLVAYFEQGGDRFLADIGPGNYMTTDGTNCNFEVTEDLEVVW